MAISRLEPSRQPWVGVLVVAVALVISATALMAEVGDGPRPSFLDGPVARQDPAAGVDDGRLRLAGSGSNLPLTRALAAAYVEQGGQRPVVHASIGSGGGLRALLDGAIDVALISRPLGDRERAQGLVDTPYARMPVAVAVHSSVPQSDLSVEGLLSIYRGDRNEWSDGTPIIVLQREPGDSSHAAIDRVLPQFAAVNDRAYRQGRWRVLFHDAAMLEALETTEGAIGLHGSGRVPGAHGYRTLTIEGVPAMAEELETGRYPFEKTLSFVTVGPPAGEAATIIEFSRAALGRGTIRQYGAMPLSSLLEED